MNWTHFGEKLTSRSGILELMDDLGKAMQSPGEKYMLGGGNPGVIPEMDQLWRRRMEEIMANGDEFERGLGNYDTPQGKERFLRAMANLLNREFTQPDSGTHWVGGITYIRSHQGWNYLATVLDLGTREIVGYALSRTPDARLVKQALINAIQMKQPNTKKLLFHSDQGVQYCANLFKETLALHGITQSMSRRGNCHDNSVQERFFRNLKTEYLNGMNFINHSSIVTAVEK